MANYVLVLFELKHVAPNYAYGTPEKILVNQEKYTQFGNSWDCDTACLASNKLVVCAPYGFGCEYQTVLVTPAVEI